MKRCFTSLTTLLCSAAVLLCSLPMQALAAEFRMQTAYEDVFPDELTAGRSTRRPGRTGSARGRKTAGSPSGGADRLRPLHG